MPLLHNVDDKQIAIEKQKVDQIINLKFIGNSV